MANYMETADKLKDAVNEFMAEYIEDHEKREDGITSYVNPKIAAVALGHIVNLAFRCNYRPVQGSVRAKVVQKAMEDFCKITLVPCRDERTGKEFKRIDIQPK